MKYTKENYEEFAIEYLEGSMSPADRNSFEHFLDLNPALKEEITGIQIVKLPYFEATLPKKKALLKPVTAHRFFLPVYVRSLAAAVLLLCIMAIFWYGDGNADRQLTGDEKIIQTEQSNTENTPVESDEQKIPLTSQKNTTDIKQMVVVSPVIAKIDTVTSRNLPQENLPELAAESLSPIQHPAQEEIAVPNQAALISDYEQRKLAARELVKTVAILNQIEITPSSNSHAEISVAVSSVPDEVAKEPENRSKLGQLLANLNLLPTGLREELEAGGFREKIIPESYRDTKL